MNPHTSPRNFSHQEFDPDGSSFRAKFCFCFFFFFWQNTDAGPEIWIERTKRMRERRETGRRRAAGCGGGPGTERLSLTAFT